jgi:acetoacetyl-CoA reductase
MVSLNKVALVTGGTRGIGESISKKLNKDGYTVIANYASNDEKAEKFSNETGIEVIKWDVSDYQKSSTEISKNTKPSIYSLIMPVLQETLLFIR